MVTELNGAKFFTIVDARKGYWHVPLDEESSYLTTFGTPFGVLRYFDPHAETVIQTDASLKGLGTVLLQDGKPVCYASKALT